MPAWHRAVVGWFGRPSIFHPNSTCPTLRPGSHSWAGGPWWLGEVQLEKWHPKNLEPVWDRGLGTGFWRELLKQIPAPR